MNIKEKVKQNTKIYTNQKYSKKETFFELKVSKDYGLDIRVKAATIFNVDLTYGEILDCIAPEYLIKTVKEKIRAKLTRFPKGNQLS